MGTVPETDVLVVTHKRKRFKGGHVLRVDRDENVDDAVINPADPARPEYFAVPGRLTLAPVRSKRGQAGPAVAQDAGASLPYSSSPTL